MASRIRISSPAQRDIEEVLAWTLREFGEQQYDEYRELIHQALLDVSRHPERAKHRPEIHEQARTFHIERTGRRARHLLLLRIGDNGIVEIAQLLHDAMDLRSHLPEDMT